jgi:hypothetical protein
MCSNRENPGPEASLCFPADGKYPSEKSSQPAYKAVKPDSRCIGFHVATKRSQLELRKPGAACRAWNLEVGGAVGGNGMEATGGPRSGGPALPCGGCCGGGSGGGGGGGRSFTCPTLEQLQQTRSGLDASVCSCGDRREPECSCTGQRRRPIPPTGGSGVLPATGGSHV